MALRHETLVSLDTLAAASLNQIALAILALTLRIKQAKVLLVHLSRC